MAQKAQKLRHGRLLCIPRKDVGVLCSNIYNILQFASILGGLPIDNNGDKLNYVDHKYFWLYAAPRLWSQQRCLHNPDGGQAN
jgi:hypothetical protein